MAIQRITFEKLRRAFIQLGVQLELPDGAGFVNFEYEGYPYMIYINEYEELFYLCDMVVGPKGNITQQVFEYALDITAQEFEGIGGTWDKEFPYIYSEEFTLRGCVFLPKPSLEALIMKFHEAHITMENYIFLLLGEIL